MNKHDALYVKEKQRRESLSEIMSPLSLVELCSNRDHCQSNEKALGTTFQTMRNILAHLAVHSRTLHRSLKDSPNVLPWRVCQWPVSSWQGLSLLVWALLPGCEGPSAPSLLVFALRLLSSCSSTDACQISLALSDGLSTGIHSFNPLPVDSSTCLCHVCLQSVCCMSYQLVDLLPGTQVILHTL